MENNALEKFDAGKLAAIVGATDLAAVNDPFSGGISGGEFLPQISIRGNRFRLKIGGQETVLKDDFIEVYLITSRSGVSKTFYELGYTSGEAKAPDCSSADGVYPDANVEHPQAANCQICPNNEWGSKINAATGKKSKACSDYKLIVVAFTAAPHEAFAMRIPGASLKPWRGYISKLNLAGCPANAAKTRISLGNTEFPSLVFDCSGTVESREDYAAVTELAQASEVVNTVKIQARPNTTPHASQQPVVVAPEPAPTPAPEPDKGLAELLGKPKTAAKKKKEVVAEEQAETPEVITSLDQLLDTLTK